MKEIRLFNTLSRSIEDFKAINPPQVKIYHCGPTVYSTQHIGNMRAMYFGDIVRRTLVHAGYIPLYVRNYTDVGHLSGDNAGDADSGEDRMEKGAKKEGISVWDIANRYISEFDMDMIKIGNTPPDFAVRATDHIQQQIEMIEILLNKGFAYITDEAVYFDVSKANNYTRLSHQKLDENIIGAGHGTAEIIHKKSPYDFALWFFRQGAYKNHTMHWDSPFRNSINPLGDGFPGWHIECSAMAKTYLGNTIDIHIGGVEHIPTHHTNEIAQSENANNDPFVKYWLHNEHLLIDGKKMSKSEGNVLNIKDLEDQGFLGIHLRYFFLNAHYKSQQNFTFSALEDAKTSYLRLQSRYKTLKELVSVNEETNVSQRYIDEFDSYLFSDFNTTGALSIIWSMLKDENVTDIDKYNTLNIFDKTLGLQLDTIQEKKEKISQELKLRVENLINQRNIARQNKDFIKADILKKELTDLNVEIRDTFEGTKWEIK